MKDEGDLPQEDTAKDEGTEAEGSRMNKLKRTRKRVTKPHLCSADGGEITMANSNERSGNQTADLNKPGSSESCPSHNDKDVRDQMPVVKLSLASTPASVPDAEFNTNAGTEAVAAGRTKSHSRGVICKRMTAK